MRLKWLRAFKIIPEGGDKSPRRRLGVTRKKEALIRQPLLRKVRRQVGSSGRVLVTREKGRSGKDRVRITWKNGPPSDKMTSRGFLGGNAGLEKMERGRVMSRLKRRGGLDSVKTSEGIKGIYFLLHRGRELLHRETTDPRGLPKRGKKKNRKGSSHLKSLHLWSERIGAGHCSEEEVEVSFVDMQGGKGPTSGGKMNIRLTPQLTQGKCAVKKKGNRFGTLGKNFCRRRKGRATN